MAVDKRAPVWLTWALIPALAAILLGERIIGEGGLRWLLSGAGFLAVLAGTVWRMASWLGASGDRARVERVLALGFLGVTVALVIMFARGELSGKTATVAQVLWPIVLAAALVPTMLASWAMSEGSEADGSLAEAHRAAELAASGLSIAFAAAFLFVAVYIASARDHKLDLSYFKTTEPGSATINMVNSMEQPLQVLLFFPEVSEVKDEVHSYFDTLAKRTGNVEIKVVDRFVDSALAKQYRVTRDGTVVLVRGDQDNKFTIDTDIKRARAKLRELDSEMQKALMKVLRAANVAYFVTGHGELNDPARDNGGARDPFLQVTAIRELLSLLNYRVKDLGLRQGLAQDVPDDATLVLLIGPQKPLLDEELAALDRYLARGGAILVALEPGSELALGPLAARLGVSFEGTPLADDKQFLPRRRTVADHRNLVTDQFSSHASVTTLSRARVGSGILFMEAGALVDAEWAADYGDPKPKRTYVVRSLSSAFNDANGNSVFDEGGAEARKSYNLIAAVEADAPAAKPKDDGSTKPMRAIVLADAQPLSDGILANVELNRGLVIDVLKWLAGEEAYSGEVKSEKDVPIKHTKDKDVVWFWTTLAGVPLFVLALGLLGVWWRRRGLRRKAA